MVGKYCASLILTIFILVLLGCRFASVPKAMKKNFTYCYDNSYSNAGSLMRLGLYRYGIKYSKSDIENIYKGRLYYKKGKMVEDKSWMELDSQIVYHYNIFYENGLYVSGYWGTLSYKGGICIPDSNELSKNIIGFFKDAIIKREKHSFYNDLSWGKYIVHGDTLKIQNTNHPSFMAPTWMPEEKWYLIKSGNILNPFGFKYIKDSPERNVSDKIILYDKKILPAIFFPTKELPSPKYSWLLKQKWFWCDEQQYKEWNKSNK